MESHNNLSNAELLTSLCDINLLWQYLQICRMLGEGGWCQAEGIQDEKLWIRGRWLNLCVERRGPGGLRTAEGLLHPLWNIHFCAYNCSSCGPVSMTRPPHTISNSNLTRINKATACWENTRLLQVTARRVDLPQTQWKISAGFSSDASLVKKDTWAQVELLSLDISSSLLRWSVHRQTISYEVSAFCYLLSNALVGLVKN